MSSSTSITTLGDELDNVLLGLSMKTIRDLLRDLSIELTWKAFHWRVSLKKEILNLDFGLVKSIISRIRDVKLADIAIHSIRRQANKRSRRFAHFDALRRMRTDKLFGSPNSEIFPDVVPDQIQEERLKLFRDHTGDNFVQQFVCISCSGRFDASDTVELSMHAIPNKHRLKPSDEHDTYGLHEGMLLHSTAIEAFHLGNDQVRFCLSCISSLQDDQTPKFSLANKMWIGDIPTQLSILTLPERLLISIYFPSAYIVKLYPKAPNARHWHGLDVNMGLRGNVSTYKLDISGIHDMVKGNLLPRPPEILASLISVTLVGPRGKPERAIRGLCQVRHRRILDALLWLKQHNLFYKTITIDDSILSRLPDDDVPESIYDNIKHVSTTSDPVEKNSNISSVDISLNEPERLSDNGLIYEHDDSFDGVDGDDYNLNIGKF